MRSLFAHDGASARSKRDPWSLLAWGLVITVVGIVLGTQYVAPDKRVLTVLAAAVMLGIAWRIDIISGIGLLLLALPYPRANVSGSSNPALVLLLVIIWFLRMNTAGAAKPRPTALDKPILGLVIAYIISFYNVEKPLHLGYGLANFLLFLGCIGIYYLVQNNVRDDHDLERLHRFQAITIASVCLVAVFELNHPGSALVPGWIDFSQTHGEALDTRNIRVGGPFFDFEQLSDFCAVSTLLVLFLLMRARQPAIKVMYAALLMLVGFTQFATVTRGGIIALLVGLLYLVWILRRRVHFVPLVLSIGTAFGLLAGMDFYVANFTRSGDLFKRLLDPQTLKFENGLPEGRAGTWIQAFNRMLEHPFIGHGPYYSLERGITFWYWPHNVYLYIANIIGLFGLSFFLWLLFTLVRDTRPVTDDAHAASYSKAYLAFAHVQLVVFMIDQFKIDYLRSPIYQFQVWVLFSLAAAGARLARTTTGPTPVS